MCISGNLQASLSRTKSRFFECDHHEGRDLSPSLRRGVTYINASWQTNGLVAPMLQLPTILTLPSPRFPPPSFFLWSPWANRRGAQLFSGTSGCVHLWHFFLLLPVSCPHWSHPFVPLLLLFSCSAVSDSLRPHGLQHARPPCPSPTPGVYPNSCPLSRWCHPAISSPATFSSSLQPFPASESFPMSQLFTSGGQSIGASASVNDSDLWIPLYFMSHFLIRTELHVGNFPPILFSLKPKPHKANFLGLLPVT